MRAFCDCSLFFIILWKAAFNGTLGNRGSIEIADLESDTCYNITVTAAITNLATGLETTRSSGPVSKRTLERGILSITVATSNLADPLPRIR